MNAAMQKGYKAQSAHENHHQRPYKITSLVTHRQKSTVKSTQNQSNRTNLMNVCSPFSDTPSPSPHLSDTTESGLPIIQEESLYRATPPRRGTGNLVP